jgi:predicted esterase
MDDQIRIPYLYEDAYQWYESFDPLGDLLTNPNPTTALEVFSKVIQHLITDCQWSPQKIHLFGFGQGGSLVAEFALLRWKEQITKHPDSFSSPLGSVISISGPLLSYPTVKNKCPTPLFVFHRSPPAESALSSNAITSFKKGFGHLKEVERAGEGMPNSREDWEPIMKFWSENLSRKQMSGLFQVMSGTTG